MKKIKIKITSVEHSKLVQELLFKSNSYWQVEKNFVSYANKAYLFTDLNEKMLHGSFLKTFEDSNCNEIKVLHPKQKIFLNSIVFKLEDSEKVVQSLNTDFYFVKDNLYFNNLISTFK